MGALMRFGLGGLVHRLLPRATFPFGTLVVNLLGCLLIGSVAGLAESRQLLGPALRVFVFIGLLGGFTTYSTFGYETFTMLRDGEALRASVNVLSHVLLGLLAVWLGYTLSVAR